MKVLVISHPVFSDMNNMGKTLKGYFSKFDSAEIAQLYLREGTPRDLEICENYYCFSDKDALLSFFKRNHFGKNYTREIIENNRIVLDDISYRGNKKERIYKFKYKHKAWMLFLRDFLRDRSRWDNPQLLGWVKKVNPDVIVFAAGETMFSYHVAQYVRTYLKKPLVVACMDDYYINNQNKHEVLGQLRQKRFLDTVRNTMDDAAAIFTICDSMNYSYGQMFQKKCYTLYTPAENKQIILNENAIQFSYIGNLSCGRYRSLLEIGKALSKLEDEKIPKHIDVYSGTVYSEYVEPLKNAPGIRFHGAISADQVLEVMANSKAVVHTESFEKDMMDRVRFSVSTKIADSLRYGPCLFAYGPQGIASIDYLEKNNAAYIISSKAHLEDGLKEFFGNVELRKMILQNARVLAVKNHNSDENPRKVRQWLEEIVACDKRN